MKILKINSSALPQEYSVSRKQVDAIVKKLEFNNSNATITSLDLPYENDIHFLQGQHVSAFFDKENSQESQEVLATSNKYTDQLIDADVIVIGAPMYNFSVPASLKAYFDLVARAGKTFSYTTEGPVGLLKDKKAYVVISTGGTPLGSDWDYSKGFLKTFLGFIGITDVEFIEMDMMQKVKEEKEAYAEELVSEI